MSKKILSFLEMTLFNQSLYTNIVVALCVVMVTPLVFVLQGYTNKIFIVWGFIILVYKFLTTKEYPFDKVLMATMRWDAGFTATTSTSLFDLLYPMQREINKINAKQQQLIRLYKGATPVFNQDVELAMKSLTNGAGECLYVDSSRPIDSLMTVINPTPLDPELSATVTEYKTAMYPSAFDTSSKLKYPL